VPLRRNASGIAENTFVSMSRGGASRYIIREFTREVRITIDEHVRAVDVTSHRAAAAKSRML
jgi:hypothetical protein